MSKVNPAARKAAVELASKGEATLAELARLAGTSRQLVRFWVLSAKVDAESRRRAHLRKLWRQHLKP